MMGLQAPSGTNVSKYVDNVVPRSMRTVGGSMSIAPNA
jgi:hypothetical protein